MKIIPLSEGAFTIDQTKKFVPFDLEKDNLQQRSKGSLLVEIQPFAMITSRDIIVLDTGLGFTDDSGQLQIHKNLADNGINASDVTKVLLTHLHKDHSGGIAYPNKKIVGFENAEYYVNKKEWDFSLSEKNSNSYKSDHYLLLEKYKGLHFIEGNGIIDDYIHYEISGAHCPHHQVFKIVENGKTVFFGGDEAPQLHQMKNKFRAKYDHDGEMAMQLRQKWWQQGKEEKWTFLFYHDIKYPIFDFE